MQLDPRFAKILLKPNILITTFIVNVILSSFYFQIQSIPRPVLFILNWIWIILINKVVVFMVKKTYKPGYYNRKKLSIRDAIHINLVKRERNPAVYENEDYDLKYYFDVNSISVYITFFCYEVILFIMVWLQVFLKTEIIHINGMNILWALMWIIAYSVILLKTILFENWLRFECCSIFVI